MASETSAEPIGDNDPADAPFSPQEMRLGALRSRLEERTPHVSYLVFRSDMIEMFGEGCLERMTEHLIEKLHGLWSAGLRVGAHERCQHCGSSEGVAVQRAMTAYHWDGTGSDPNADSYLCRPCAEEYVSTWNERWSEYHSGLL